MLRREWVVRAGIHLNFRDALSVGGLVDGHLDLFEIERRKVRRRLGLEKP